jgi:outer membrane autotransporter protein
LNQGADFLADRGLSAALQNGAQSKRQSFAAIGGSRVKHETGSHVDVEGYSLVAGLAVTRPLPAGEVTVGAFIEHGEGDYDTSNSFSNAASVHGKGEANYTGGGVLAHLTFGENARGDAFYTEASAHAGKVKLDFATRDLLDAFGRRAAYDSDSSYASAHAGLGYIWNVSDSDRVKLYSQYLWSRQGSDTVKLTTGEPVKFADVDSHRTRLGARWSHRLNQNGQAYLGAAWEREYDGKARASIHGYSLRTPDLKGNTGLVEAGFAFTPSANQPLTLDIGVQGYAGKREGVTGSFRLNYRF